MGMENKHTITAEEWKDMEFRLYDLGQLVYLVADGYKLGIIAQREKSKLYLFVYVNDQFKFEWIKEDCEIRQRFMCPSKKCVIKSKELNQVTKSKKAQAELRERYSYVYYSPYWSSFSRLKKHLIENNERLSLL